MKEVRSEPTAPAPGPYSWESSGKPGGNGDFNYYLIDKDKRKIAAVWGKRGEKEATANLLMASHDMLAALKVANDHIEHMAKWIGDQKAGYSFEALGEDMPGIRAAIELAEKGTVP